jgi:nitrous oxidase accessory protein NosD
VLACAIVVPTAAEAATFTVASTGDQAGTALGVGCLTEAEKEEEKEEEECTLRAAIEAANSLEGFDEIVFEEAVFDGQAGSTIALGSSLPAITEFAGINGRACSTAAGVAGPCVGVDGPSSVGSALTVENAEGVEITGLAVTGAKRAGIDVVGSAGFRTQASWFGVKLDGSPGGNGTGILIGPRSDNSLIGSEGSERRDVFAENTGDGLDVHGASKVRVLGNYFGVAPDGVTPAANGGDDVEVASVEGFEATGTAIGTRVSAVAAASAECDGGCNLISGAASNGIDLEGDGESSEEAPAISTAVAGNYIGLDAAGAAPIPNTAAGIRVGEAAHTVIGGPSAGAANRINGGSTGVVAGPGADDLAVRGNLIGAGASGSSTLDPPGDGIVVDSAELPNAAAEAQIVDNVIRMEGGVGIAQQGEGAWIAGNEISGSETGIRTSESVEPGNVIEGNLIEAPTVNGILVENNFNEVFGNEILGAGDAGILIQGAPFAFGVSGNLVGGDVASEENVIAASGGAAIEISNLTETENEVARNRGIANHGPFIDLVAVSPGAEPGPNNGIEPPGFSISSPLGAGGSAEPGAVVRVFRKQIAAGGEIESFLGEATADESGGWSVVYGNPIPAGTIVAATQTNELGGTSELAATTAGVAGGAVGGGRASAESGGQSESADEKPPQTKIVMAPKKTLHGKRARFGFESDEAGSSFQCKLDGKPFRACRSPKKYEEVKPGRHVFAVRAIDPAGNVDPTPATKKFRVQAKP